MTQILQEDSPFFRNRLSEQEKSLDSLVSMLSSLISSSTLACSHGTLFKSSLSSLYSSLYSYSLFPVPEEFNILLKSFSDSLDGILNFLQHTVIHQLSSLITEHNKQIEELKKEYQSTFKSFDTTRNHTLSYKKQYVTLIQAQRNPIPTENHFVKLYSAEKAYETARFDYKSGMDKLESSYKKTVCEIYQGLIFSYTVFSIQTYAKSLSDALSSHSSITDFLASAYSSLSESDTILINQIESERKAYCMHLNIYDKLPQLKSTKSGYLWKQGNLLHEWKLRYFYIKDSALYYHKRGQEILFCPLILSKVVELPDDEHLFAFEVIISTENKSKMLIADCERDMTEWIHALTVCSEVSLGDRGCLNYVCADCGTSGADWCSMNLAVILCKECCGIHRSLGSHISKVRSVALDNLSKYTLEVLEALHSYQKEIWEPNNTQLKPNRFSPTEIKAQYIRHKYIQKDFMISPASPASSLSSAIQASDLPQAMIAIQSGALSTDHHEFLHEATFKCFIPMIELLLLSGCDISSRNKSDCTALDLALVSMQVDVMNYLLSKLE